MIGINLGIRLGMMGGGGGASEPLEQTLTIDTFLADGTHTTPAELTSPGGTPNAVYVEAWGAGGGGTTDTGGGGGGAFAAGEVAVAPSTGYAVVAGQSVSNTNGGDSSYNATSIVAKGGLSGGNGGTAGTAAASTGATKFSGGAGALGTGNQSGGAGAGSGGAASGVTAGLVDGGIVQAGGVGRFFGGGGGSQAATQLAGGHGAVSVSYLTPAPTGFPRLKGYARGRSVANGTSHVVDFSDVSSLIEVGDRLVLCVASDGAPDLSVTDWTEVEDVNDTSVVACAVFTKVAAGSDSATISATATEAMSWTVLVFSASGAPTATGATGSSTNADGPSHDHGSSAKCVWLSVVAWDLLPVISAAPANYGNVILVPAGTLVGATLGIAMRFLEAQTENPGAWTSATEQWAAITVALPAA